MSYNKKLFVDLDRTLLDTDVFVATLWHYLGKTYGIDTDKEKSQSSQYFTYDGDMYDYHFFDHLQALQIGDVDKIAFELTLYMQKQFLLFNDTEAGLKVLDDMGEFTILTFGNQQYQQFKLSCVPELLKYPVVMVQQHKKHYFSEQCREPALLIDDKDIASELPDNVEFIRIDRTQPLPVMEHEGYKSIRKLQNIKEALQQ